MTSAATGAAALANQLGVRIEAQPHDAGLTLRLLRRISDDADEIPGEGEALG